MPDLKDLRALIHDHEAKDAGLTVDVQLCLKTWLADELDELQEQRAEAVAEVQARVQELVAQFQGSMAEPADVPDPDTDSTVTSLDDEITAKQAEVDAATITLHFKALSEPKYRDVLRDAPTVPSETSSTADDGAFLALLTERCYQGVNWGGAEFTATDLPWSEVIASLSFGEVDPIYGQVWILNRQDKSRRPTSSRQSKPSRRI